MSAKKGITPIISIIILLLITVGLAASAWTYMSNYMTTLTAKAIEIPTQQCIEGEKAMAIVHNIGTSSILVGGAKSDIIIMNSSGSSIQGTWTDLQDNPLTNITSGGYAKVVIGTCCSGNECPKTCSYNFIVGGRSYTVSVYCPGA